MLVHGFVLTWCSWFLTRLKQVFYSTLAALVESAGVKAAHGNQYPDRTSTAVIRSTFRLVVGFRLWSPRPCHAYTEERVLHSEKLRRKRAKVSHAVSDLLCRDARPTRVIRRLAFAFVLSPNAVVIRDSDPPAHLRALGKCLWRPQQPSPSSLSNRCPPRRHASMRR
jgi:hypothetical protein